MIRLLLRYVPFHHHSWKMRSFPSSSLGSFVGVGITFSELLKGAGSLINSKKEEKNMAFMSASEVASTAMEGNAYRYAVVR